MPIFNRLYHIGIEELNEIIFIMFKCYPRCDYIYNCTSKSWYILKSCYIHLISNEHPELRDEEVSFGIYR